MATLGDSSTPTTLNWNDQVAQNREFRSVGGYTMPAGGGIVTDMVLYIGGYGMSASAQAVIYNSDGTIRWSSASGGIGNGITWVHFAVPSVYLPPGTYSLGFWLANGQHVQWQTRANGTGGVQRLDGVSAPATMATSVDEYGGAGYGVYGVYCTYTPGGVGYVNTGTSAAPVWTQAQIVVNTGTPAAPVWTAAEVMVNTGTPAAPVWTTAT